MELLARNESMHGQKEEKHFSSPRVMKLLPEEFEFAQHMRVAQAMKTREEKIGFETVMDQTSEELREMAEVREGLRASFGVDSIPGQNGVG